MPRFSETKDQVRNVSISRQVQKFAEKIFSNDTLNKYVQSSEFEFTYSLQHAFSNNAIPLQFAFL